MASYSHEWKAIQLASWRRITIWLHVLVCSHGGGKHAAKICCGSCRSCGPARPTQTYCIDTVHLTWCLQPTKLKKLIQKCLSCNFGLPEWIHFLVQLIHYLYVIVFITPYVHHYSTVKAFSKCYITQVWVCLQKILHACLHTFTVLPSRILALPSYLCLFHHIHIHIFRLNKST